MQIDGKLTFILFSGEQSPYASISSTDRLRFRLIRVDLRFHQKKESIGYGRIRSLDPWRRCEFIDE